MRAALGNGGGFTAAGERYDLSVGDEAPGDEEAHRAVLGREVTGARAEERRARRSLVGPHRDAVVLRVDGEDAAVAASAGQARSLLLALTLAALEVYRRERGETPVALLDDLDSELDEERVAALCRTVTERGQALVTTAHGDWVARLGRLGQVFEVHDGQVRAA